jgi:hypothetical protein
MIGAGFAAAVAAPVYEALGPAWLFCGAGALMALLVIAARVLDTRGAERAVPHPFDLAIPDGVARRPDHLNDVETPVGPVRLDPADDL